MRFHVCSFPVIPRRQDLSANFLESDSNKNNISYMILVMHIINSNIFAFSSKLFFEPQI